MGIYVEGGGEMGKGIGIGALVVGGGILLWLLFKGKRKEAEAGELYTVEVGIYDTMNNEYIAGEVLINGESVFLEAGDRTPLQLGGGDCTLYLEIPEYEFKLWRKGTIECGFYSADMRNPAILDITEDAVIRADVQPITA